MHINSKQLYIFLAVVIGVPLTALLAVHLCQGECVTYKSDKAKAELYSLYSAVQLFRLDTGRYPAQQEGLDALVRQPEDTQGWIMGGYLITAFVPHDAWGNQYIYISRPELSPPFEIISLGADGVLGGTGEDADLSTRQLINK